MRVGLKRLAWATLAIFFGLIAWQFYVFGTSGQAETQLLIEFGARKVTHGFPNPPWRLAASVFLHAGWWHLFTNLFIWWFWGARLEKLLGSVELLVFFVVAGTWSSLVSDMVGPDALALGASGAVFGVVGAVLGLSLTGPAFHGWAGDGEAARWMKVSIAVLVLNGFTALGFSKAIPGARLDHWAHASGAVYGMIVGLSVGAAGSQRARKAYWALTALATILGYVVISSRGLNPFR